MERETRESIHRKVAQIRFLYGADIEVNFCSPGGRSRGQITNNQGSALSMRLTIQELVEWLDGYCKALDKMRFRELLEAAVTLAELANIPTGVHKDFQDAAAIVNDIKIKVKEAKGR